MLVLMQVMEEANSRRSSRVATPTGSNCFPDSILDIEEKVMMMTKTMTMIMTMTIIMTKIITMTVTMTMMTRMMMTKSIQVAYMSDVVDRAASATPTDRVSLSR